MTYKYITENNIENKQNYMYSEYGGKQFLDLYLDSRNEILVSCHSIDCKVHNSYVELLGIYEKLEENDTFQGVKDLLDAYVKTFEVRKRIYTEYDYKWKPVDNSRYDFIDNYMLLAKCVIEAYKNGKCSKYLSVLLKIDDTLISLSGNMTNRQKLELKYICEEELDLVKALGNRMGVNF